MNVHVLCEQHSRWRPSDGDTDRSTGSAGRGVGAVGAVHRWRAGESATGGAGAQEAENFPGTPHSAGRATRTVSTCTEDIPTRSLEGDLCARHQAGPQGGRLCTVPHPTACSLPLSKCLRLFTLPPLLAASACASVALSTTAVTFKRLRTRDIIIVLAICGTASRTSAATMAAA